MGLHGLKNKTSRNSFDLSHRNLFTAKVGELLPCFVQEVNPGDSIKLDSSYLLVLHLCRLLLLLVFVKMYSTFLFLISVCGSILRVRLKT